MRIQRTPEMIKVAKCAEIAGGFSAKGFTEDFTRNEHIHRNTLEAHYVHQSNWGPWILEKLGIANPEYELKNHSMDEFDANFKNLPANLKKIFDRTKTYFTQKKSRGLFGGNHHEDKLTDHRYMIVLKVFENLEAIAQANDLDEKIRLSQQFKLFIDHIFADPTLYKTSSQDENYLSLSTTLLYARHCIGNELTTLIAEKEKNTFSDNLRKLDALPDLLEEVNQLLLNIAIPKKIPEGVDAFLKKRIEGSSSFDEYKAEDKKMNRAYSNIIEEEVHYDFVKKHIVDPNQLPELTKDYANGNESVEEKISVLTQTVTSKDLERLYLVKGQVMDLNRGFWTQNVYFPQNILEDLSCVINTKNKLLQTVYSIKLIHDLNTQAGKTTLFYGKTSIVSLFEELSLYLAHLQTSLTCLEKDLEVFREQNNSELKLNGTDWNQNLLTNLGKFVTLQQSIHALKEATNEILNLATSTAIEENFDELQDKLIQLSRATTLLFKDNPNKIKEIEDNASKNVDIIENIKKTIPNDVEIKLHETCQSILGVYQELNSSNLGDSWCLVDNLDTDTLFEEIQKQEDIYLNQASDLNKSANLSKSILNLETSSFSLTQEIQKDNIEKLKKEVEELTQKEAANQEKITQLSDQIKHLQGLLELNTFYVVNELGDSRRLVETKENELAEISNQLETIKQEKTLLETRNNFFQERIDVLERKEALKNALDDGLRILKTTVYEPYNKDSQQFGAFFKGMRARHGNNGIIGAGNSLYKIDQTLKGKDITYDSLFNAIDEGVNANPKGGSNGHSWNTILKAFKYELNELRRQNFELTNAVIAMAVENVSTKLNARGDNYSKEEVETLKQNAWNLNLG